jgi:hypothetical protein
MQKQKPAPHFITQHWLTLRFVLLVTAIVVQGFYNFHTGPMLEHDAANQLGAVHQILDGHGVSLPMVTDSTNLTDIAYQPMTQWPVTFSLLLAAFQLVTGDLWWSAMLVQWINVLIFFSAWFVITETLGDFFSIPVRLALWLFWIVIYSPVLTSTDGFTLAIFSASLALVIIGLKQQSRLGQWVVLSGLVMALVMSLRYAYWPLVVVVPGSLLFYALLNKRYDWIKWAFLHGALSVIGMGAVMLWNQVTANILVRGYLSVNDERPDRLLFENLRPFVPFPAQALGTVSSLRIIGSELKLSEIAINSALWLIAAIFMLGLLSMVWHTARKPQADTVHPAWVIFATGLLLTIVLTVYLSYLSITTEKFWGWWIYVQDMRFFHPVFPFIALALFTLLLQPEKTHSVWVRRIVGTAVVIAIVGGMVVRIPNWRWISRTFKFEGGIDSVENMPLLTTVRSLQASDNQPIIFVRGETFDSGGWDAQAALAGIPVYRGRLTAETTFAADKPVTLLVAIPQPDAGDAEEIEFLTQLVVENGGRWVTEVPDFLQFYVVYLGE